MTHIIGIVVAIGLLILIIWLLIPSNGGKSACKNDIVFDSSDARQIGFLIGMTGGSIASAVVAQYALKRFEEIHGRKATSRDIGEIVGLSKKLKQEQST